MVCQDAQAAVGANACGDIHLTVSRNGHITGGNSRHAGDGDSSLPGFRRKPVPLRVRAYSYQKIAEDLRNLAAFGGNLLEMQEALGLGYRDLRLLRQGIAELPPAEREAILAEVDAADGPEAMKDKLAELKLELARAKVEKKEMEETLAAKEKVSKDKGERLDALEEKINRLTSMAPDDQQKALNDINAGAREGVDKKYQQVFLAVVELIGHCATMLTDDRITEESCAYVHERVGQLMDTVANMVLRAGIDVDLRARFELPGEDEPQAGNGAE